MANTTWNPADLSNTTLSGGNLIAAATAAIGGVRSVASKSTGKYYWENTYTVLSSNTLTCGVSLASTALASPTSGSSRVARSNGNIFVNGGDTAVSISGGAGLAQGSVICIAVDFTAQLIWFRLGAAGQWNGSGTANPATATGGRSIAAISTGPLFAMMAGQIDTVTANFGDTAFTGAVPAGFTAGLPAITSMQVTQEALEHWAIATPPPMRVTQAAIEQWTSTANLTTRMLMTQEAIEQWSTVAEVSAITARQAAITVVT